MSNSDLGKLISVHGVSAALLQRSIIIILISLFFAAAMFVGFLITQKFILLLLAVAFSAINLLTLFGLIARRKKVFRLYEQGFNYNKISSRFDEIANLKVTAKSVCEISTNSGEKIMLTEAIAEIAEIIEIIEAKIK
jgi:hypothetical protein